MNATEPAPARQANSRSPKRRAEKRSRILDAALTLFNERGTAAVSTNLIAEAAEISPGNLYYWFANKQAIIGALYDQWAEESEYATLELASPADAVRMLVARTVEQLALARRYWFFARELVELLHEDEELATKYRENYATKTAQIERVVEVLIAEGLLREPLPPLTVHSTVAASWALTELGSGFFDVVAAPEAGRPEPLAESPLTPIVATPLFAMLTPRGAELLRTS